MKFAGSYPMPLQILFNKSKRGGSQLKKFSGDNNKQFTLDGRLVGDIGELLAEYFFDIVLNEKQKRSVDGAFLDSNNTSRQVEVKCRRMSTVMWFDSEPEFLIVFKIHPTPDDSNAHEMCSLIYAGLGAILHKVRGSIEYSESGQSSPKRFKDRQAIATR